MKKIAIVIEIIGALLALISMCADVTEHPILSIPIIIGWCVFFIGTKIDGGWQDEEEIIESDSFHNNGSYIDDDITYITYDSSGAERYLDFR